MKRIILTSLMLALTSTAQAVIEFNENTCNLTFRASDLSNRAVGEHFMVNGHEFSLDCNVINSQLVSENKLFSVLLDVGAFSRMKVQIGGNDKYDILISRLS